jgi:hypothetical protein
MRGSDERTGELFPYVDLEKRVPAKHPLRLVRSVVNDVLAALDSDFSKAYADGGRPSIAPGLNASSWPLTNSSGHTALDALSPRSKISAWVRKSMRYGRCRC